MLDLFLLAVEAIFFGCLCGLAVVVVIGIANRIGGSKKEGRQKFIREVAAELWVRDYDMTAENCIKNAETLVNALERKEAARA